MKLKLSSFREEKQILKADLTCKELELNDECLVDPVKVEVKTGRNSSCLTVECKIRVEAKFNCDRCLEEFNSEINAETSFALTDNPKMNSDSEDMIYLSSGEDIIDISKNIRDAILLVYPYKRVCSQDCRGLCPGCGKNLNTETCECTKVKIDPRWEKLRELKK
eukprot:Anaeramoba_ignava/a1540_25.p1 GENE.a1540_25~~a1540_25.p1  ORF type:complete len:164 (-),score=17.32 a1540_25:153-644(-)